MGDAASPSKIPVADKATTAVEVGIVEREVTREQSENVHEEGWSAVSPSKVCRQLENSTKDDTLFTVSPSRFAVLQESVNGEDEDDQGIRIEFEEGKFQSLLIRLLCWEQVNLHSVHQKLLQRTEKSLLF